MKQQYTHLLLIPILMFLLSTASGASEVVSEGLVFLKEDGRSYLLQRSMRSTRDRHDFHVDKDIGLKDFLYIEPNEYTWDDATDADVNTLRFSGGSFTVMYPGTYTDEVAVYAAGIHTLTSWDGTTREDGHFGMWHEPGNFTRFVYAWVFPDNLRILNYESNREGEWVERNNTLAFFATDVNDLTFTLKFEQLDTDADGVADTHDQCPATPAGTAVDTTGCEPDADGDGVRDGRDRCPETPANTPVDAEGCELDADKDGIPNRLDQCAATPAKAIVDARGCERDADGDGVVDRLDECPETPAGALVDRQGCELDCDEDEVPNSADQCPRTPAGAGVDSRGCELDSDGDGIADSADRCPGTAAGANVDAQGCDLQLDADRDGVVDSGDLCPGTPRGVAVDLTGCPPAQPITLRGVNFHFNSDELTEESKVILDGVAETLRAHPDLRLEVAGHTDAEGDNAVNLDLSQRRAESVRAYLISKGISPGNLNARGYGEQQPVQSNDTAQGRAENRRVELLRTDASR
jgi:outer membrane protein OmpA-like peptidoglycan-associated protein